MSPQYLLHSVWFHVKDIRELKTSVQLFVPVIVHIEDDSVQMDEHIVRQFVNEGLALGILLLVAVVTRDTL